METTETIMHYSNNNPYATVPVPAYHTYASYHTPPYTLNYDTWSDINCSSNLAIIQMQQPQQHQQLRFPTPPITPPRVHTNPPELPSESIQVTTTTTLPTQPLQHHQQSQHQQQPQHQQQRMSVIMKIGHDPNSPQHVSNIMPLLHSTSPAEPSTLPHNHHQQQQQQQHHNDTPSSGNSSPFSNNDFVCDWLDCARYFDSLESLAAHVTQMHAVACTTDGLYYCKWTGCQRSERGFNARYKMLVHVRTHTKEKPHQCNLCDKRFSRAENLKIHIRSHSGEKPYICTFEGCNKAYSNSSDRFKHTRTHSMEKPYKCKVPGCQKRYTDPSSLRKHVKTFKHSQQIMVDSMHFLHSEQQQTKQEYRNEEESHYLPLEDVEALSKHRHSLHLPYHLMPSSYTSAAFLEQQHAGAAVIPQQDTFCLAMEEMCHIKASIDCYKSSDRTASAEESSSMPYWLQGQDDIDSAESALYYKSLYHDHHHDHHQQHHHHQTELTMELDLTKDKPLDLSLKRF